MLKRYDIYVREDDPGYDSFAKEEEDPRGFWVKVEDLRKALKEIDRWSKTVSSAAKDYACIDYDEQDTLVKMLLGEQSVLKRYDIWAEYGAFWDAEEEANGDWIKVEDLKKALEGLPPTPGWEIRAMLFED